MDTADPLIRRRSYRPVEHPGLRDRWSGPLILEALRVWARETGRAPRRRDWTGEDAAVAGPAQRRWMREHPRWPSSSCVAAHFGSWSAALEAAGLPARRLTFDSTPAERVQTAHRLAASGQSRTAIAAALGVSVTSVYNYLRADRCPRCGEPMTTPGAAACRDCTRAEPTVQRAWTRDDVRRAILDWTAEHERPPSYRDWTPCRERPGAWEAASPRWPSAAVVVRLYGEAPDPWNSALRDAGARARHRKWSEPAIRLALANVWARLGREPTPADLRSPDWDGPCPATLRRRYGGLAEAWAQLGPAPAIDE